MWIGPSAVGAEMAEMVVKMGWLSMIEHIADNISLRENHLK